MRTLLLLLSVLLLAPLASAGSPVNVAITSTGGHLDGPSAISGPLTGFALSSQQASTGADLQLTALKVAVRALVADPSLEPTGPLPIINVEPQNDNADLADVTLHSVAVRDGALLRVFPIADHELPTVTLESNCLSLEAAHGSETYSPYVPEGNLHGGNTRHPSFDAEGTAKATPCNSSLTTRLKGDFLVTMWQWDYHYESASGSKDDTTGITPSRTGPAPIPGATRHREAFLYVTGGELTLPVHAVPVFWLSGTSQASLTGSLRVSAMEGSIDAGGSSIRVGKGPAEISGHLNGQLVAQSGLQAWRLSGEADQVRIASQVVSLEGGPGQAWSWWLAGALVVLGGMSGAGWRWATPGRRALQLVRRAVYVGVTGDNQAALRLTDRSLRVKETARGHMARAMALKGQGDHLASIREHDAAEAMFDGDVDAFASNSREATRSALALGDIPLAEKRFRRTLELDRDVALQALAEDPDFAPLRPRFLDAFRAPDAAYA